MTIAKLSNTWCIGAKYTRHTGELNSMLQNIHEAVLIAADHVF